MLGSLGSAVIVAVQVVVVVWRCELSESPPRLALPALYAVSPLGCPSPHPRGVAGVFGWGRTTLDGSLVSTLQSTLLTPYQDATCTAVYGDAVDTQRQRCAGGDAGRGMCIGDDGGPMLNVRCVAGASGTRVRSGGWVVVRMVVVVVGEGCGCGGGGVVVRIVVEGGKGCSSGGVGVGVVVWMVVGVVLVLKERR